MTSLNFEERGFGTAKVGADHSDPVSKTMPTLVTSAISFLTNSRWAYAKRIGWRFTGSPNVLMSIASTCAGSAKSLKDSASTPA